MAGKFECDQRCFHVKFPNVFSQINLKTGARNGTQKQQLLRSSAWTRSKEPDSSALKINGKWKCLGLKLLTGEIMTKFSHRLIVSHCSAKWRKWFWANWHFWHLGHYQFYWDFSAKMKIFLNLSTNITVYLNSMSQLNP